MWLGGGRLIAFKATLSLFDPFLMNTRRNGSHIMIQFHFRGSYVGLWHEVYGFPRSSFSHRDNSLSM